MSAQRTPTGPPPPPVVQRLRLRYAKRGRLRFSSHRDFQRALERALRRIDAPMAYSAGFNPHPKISYAGAAPTGACSEAEYVEIGLARPVEPAAFARALDAALPPGLDVVEAVEASTTEFPQRLQASVWRIEVPGVSRAAADRAARAMIELESAEISKRTKSGQRIVDVRAALIELAVDTSDDTSDDAPGDTSKEPVSAAQGGPGDCAILRMVVRHTTPVVRPDDVLAALVSRGLLAPPSPIRMTRLAQGPLDQQGDTVADPLAADRDPVGA